MKKRPLQPLSKTMPVRENGFTLIEILVAIVILTVGLLAVAKMQVSAIQGNYFSNSATTALNLAQQKMEDLLSKSFTHADLADYTPPTEIEPITKTITIIVTWTKGANTHSVNLSCIKRL